MKRLMTLTAASLLLAGCAEKDPVMQIADKVFDLAKVQYTEMEKALGPDEFPKCTDSEGRLVRTGIDWWGSGFHPGSLWYVYEYTGDETFRELAWDYTGRLEALIDRRTSHDIGFQINCSYGNALRLTGDSAAVVPTYLAAARKLADRFNPVAGVTRSWDGEGFLVIIDNMMNLELLTTAERISGEKRLADVANSHAATTMKNHFRPDWSCWHLLDYDVETGAVRCRETVQGFAHESAWARGQAWALYGFTMMYRETGRKEYLEAAENIGDMLIRRLPEDGIPYWDFNAPGTPEALDGNAPGAADNSHAYTEPVYRDASAGAIMASAFIELSTLTENAEAAEKYLDTARRQLLTFGTEEYLARPGENGNFVLKHSVGHLPGGHEVDVAISYAEYYFLEALVRYSKL